jgi:hypothetical protein
MTLFRSEVMVKRIGLTIIKVIAAIALLALFCAPLTGIGLAIMWVSLVVMLICAVVHSSLDDDGAGPWDWPKSN